MFDINDFSISLNDETGDYEVKYGSFKIFFRKRDFENCNNELEAMRKIKERLNLMIERNKDETSLQILANMPNIRELIIK